MFLKDKATSPMLNTGNKDNGNSQTITTIGTKIIRKQDNLFGRFIKFDTADTRDFSHGRSRNSWNFYELRLSASSFLL